MICEPASREFGRAEHDRIGAVRTLPVFLLGVILLAALIVASLSIGARSISPATVFSALFSYSPDDTAHIIVHDYRVPRTLLAVLCGAAFGAAGALIQAATRNPLADPGILGVNAGAAFFVTLAVGWLGWSSIEAYVWAALAGAIIVTLAVYCLGTFAGKGATPARLVLAGVAMSSVLGGIGASIALLNPQAFDVMRHWALGSVAGRDLEVVSTVVPFIAIGLVAALCSARPLNAVAMGDDIARSLGADILQARILAIVAVTLLAGAATAAAGPIGFIGLMVPHIVRWLVGPDQRRIIPLTMLFAPALLIAADIAGRLVLHPDELEAGIVTAFVGAPVLILLVRRKRAAGL